MSQSKMYSRLQTRLNPVPESLNSPDIPVPSLSQVRPQRDDPMLYNRDHVMSMSLATAMSQQQQLQQQQQHPYQSLPPMSSSLIMPNSNGGGYSSSSDAEFMNKNNPKPKPRGSRLPSRATAKGTPPSGGDHGKGHGSKGRSVSAGGNSSGGNGSRKLSLPNKQVSELRKGQGSHADPNGRKRQHQMSTADDDSSPSESETDHHRISRRNQSPARNNNNRKTSSGNERMSAGSSSSNNKTKTKMEPKSSCSLGGGRSMVKTGSMTRSQSARLSSIDTGNSSSGVSPRQKLSSRYAPEKYDSERETSCTPRQSNSVALSRSQSSCRPGSAPVKNGVASSNGNRPRSNTLNNRAGKNNSAVNSRKAGSGSNNNTLPSSKTSQSATVIQKHWKGHQTRNKDEKVLELKQEIRGLRTDDHIKHLTKELQTAKQALEQERKLRALQMDAIKVLWKEVQMMDSAKSSAGEKDKPRPSGVHGSKISSRSSEHSIARLMETLEATTGSAKTPSSGFESAGEGRSPQQSNIADTEAVKKLNRTCNSLQGQVEQLQNSLNGVMKFMSAFSAGGQDGSGHDRTRHSSSTSTQDTCSFQFYPTPTGPQSLPPSMFTSMVDPNMTPKTMMMQAGQMYTSLDPSAMAMLPQQMMSSSGVDGDRTVTQSQVDVVCASKSCDSLVQTDLSALVTPKAEEANRHPVFYLKAAADGNNQPLDSDSGLQESQATAPPRSKSPRPSTLPGLNQPQTKKGVPGLTLLAGKAILESPQAPPQVKVYAKTLVEGLFTDSISTTTGLHPQVDDTDISLSLAECSLANNNSSVGAQGSPQDVSQSSQGGLETDSLDENSPKKVGSAAQHQQ